MVCLVVDARRRKYGNPSIRGSGNKSVKNSSAIAFSLLVVLALFIAALSGEFAPPGLRSGNIVEVSAQPVTSDITATPIAKGTFPGLQNGSTANVTITTGNMTIPANRLALLWVGQANGYLGPPILADPSRTWVPVGTTFIMRSLTLFRSMEPVDTTSATSITAPATQIVWSVVGYSNVDTSGVHGSGAIAQSVARKYADAGVGLSRTANVSLAESIEVGSATVGGFLTHWNARPLIVGNGYSFTGNASCYVLCVQPEFRSDFARVVNMTWSGDLAHWLVAAVELRSAVASPPSVCGNGIVEGYEQCDDGNSNPCDGCNSFCQPEVLQARYQDLDSDAFGNSSLSMNSFCLPNGYVNNNADCDDSLSTGQQVNPSLVENIQAANCNDSLDNDCDGTVDLTDSGCVAGGTGNIIQYVIGSLNQSCNNVCVGAGKACNLSMTNAPANTLPSCSNVGQDVKRFSDNVCGNVLDGCTTVRTIAGNRSCACQ